jgi:hypothetical protein
MFMTLAIWMAGEAGMERNAYALTPAKIDTSKAPSRPFDATDPRLRDAANIFERALSAPTVLCAQYHHILPYIEVFVHALKHQPRNIDLLLVHLLISFKKLCGFYTP